jgi:hypothetical protein
MFGPKRQKVTGRRRNCVTSKFAFFIIRAIKSNMTRWAEHATCMREVRNAYKILVEKP